VQILPPRPFKVNKININLTSKTKQRLNEVKFIYVRVGYEKN